MIVKLLANVSYYIPELICVLLMGTLMFMEAAYSKKDKERDFIYITALIGLSLVCLVLGFCIDDAPAFIYSNAIAIDPFSTIVKLIMTLGTMGVLYMAYTSKDIYESLKSEFVILAVAVLVGGMLLASANNMLSLYLGIEILSILSYVMSSLKREDSKSTEAGMKYALYGGITSGVMLFGMSHIYGATNSIQFNEIVLVLNNLPADGPTPYFIMASFMMFFAGIGYKISCVPFHMWSPDVYEGSPIPVTSFFSIVPKMAGLAALIRVSLVFFDNSGSLATVWVGMLHVIAALTMTVGNVSAIGQESMKRLLAFSSIGHVGMMLLGVVVMNQVGTSAIVFYGITYLFMTLVAFYITSFVSNEYGSDKLHFYNGLINKHPFISIVMIITFFSLAGLPPMSGFIAKFNIFSAVIEKGYYSLAVIAAVNSVIALYYYMRVVKIVVFGKTDLVDKVSEFNFKNQLLIGGLTVPVVLLGIFWDNIMHLSSIATLLIAK